MKRFVLSVMATAGLAAASPAMSADWTGFYVSGGAGYGAWSADTTTVNPTTGAPILSLVQTQGGKGALGTIGIGYDYQYNTNIVLGLLADYDFSSLKGTIQDQGPFYAANIKQTYAIAAGVRVGWLFNPDTLGFVSGGWSRTHFSGGAANFAFPPNAASGTEYLPFSKNGWFLGLGVETQVSPGWFLRGEYRCASYGNTNIRNVITATGATGAASIAFKPTVQTGKLQVVYKF